MRMQHFSKKDRYARREKAIIRRGKKKKSSTKIK